jgi:hypothetical protein
MRTFEVFLNKKRLCIAGIVADGVWSAMVDPVSGRRRRLELSAGGLDTSAEEQARWVDRHLRARDQIRIRIAKGSKADRPVERFLRDRSAEVESKKAVSTNMPSQPGWEIRESD